jgi:hypothetical protein
MRRGAADVSGRRESLAPAHAPDVKIISRKMNAYRERNATVV